MSKSLRPSSTALRKRVFDRDKGVCASCRAEDERWEADHIIPLIEGGHPTHRDNIRTLCRPCHKEATRQLARRRTGRFTGHHANQVRRLEVEGLSDQLHRESLGKRIEPTSNRTGTGSQSMKLNDAFPSNWLKAADIDEDMGPLALTIKSAEMEPIKTDKGTEQKLVLKFRETEKGLICNVTNAKTIGSLYGDDTDDWIGKQIALVVAEVSFGSDLVAAIRVSKKAPKPKAAPKARPVAAAVDRDPGEDDADEDSPF